MSNGVIDRVKADLMRVAKAERTTCGTKFVLRMLLLTPGFQFVLARRIGEALGRVPMVGRPLRRIWFWWTCRRFSSEIAIGAEVGGGLYIPHPFGIVIGAGLIGSGVTILQNVTVGARDITTPGVPVIGDGAYLAAGSVLVGSINIGAGALIGANAVVRGDVPPGATAVGVPARIIVRQTVVAA